MREFPNRLQRSARAAAALVLLLAAAAFADVSPPALFEQIGSISAELEAITGLRLRRPVPYDYITREKVQEFLRKRVKEVARPEEIRAEEIALKKLGLAPADFDLAKTTVDLLTEQAAAFYDYNAKKLFITETTPEDNQTPALVHELAHALADQNFNLAKFIRQGSESDDGSLARMAVMEGQASWLMSEYLARKNGQSLETSPALAEAMSRVTEGGAGQFPVYERTPLYFRRSLVFPYTKGLLFQQAVVEKHGKRAFAEVFRNPPVSTQQILHPGKYFAGIRPTEPAFPAIKLPRGYKELVGGTFGEFDAGVLLEQYAGAEKASAIAPHWRGARFDVREKRGAGARTVLLLAAEWDDEPSAREFFAAYREVLAKKWKALEISTETADEVAGRGDDGFFRVVRTGTVVTSVEGLASAVN